VKFKSSIYTQVSGSIGGTTYARNRYGMYARSRAMPVNPNTSYQQLVRAYVAQLAAAWSAELDDDQRAAWNTYAANVPLVDKLGTPQYVTGLNHFIRSNSVRLRAGLARVDDGPSELYLPWFTNPTIAANSGTEQLSVTFTNTDEWAGEVGGAMLVFASSPQPATVNFFKGPYRYLGKIAGAATPPTSPQSFSLPYDLTAGQRVFARIEIVRADGRVSNPFRLDAVAS